MNIKPVPNIKDLYISECGSQVWYYAEWRSARNMRPPNYPTTYPACHRVSVQVDKYGYNYIQLPTPVAKLNRLGKLNKKGYYRPMKKKIHQLVAITFVQNKEGLNYVDHINSIKSDNRAINLRWVSRGENNTIDFQEKGIEKTRDKYPENLKLTALDLMINKGYTIREVSRETGIKTNTLSEARRQDTWKRAWRRFNDQS